ncbi:MAG: SIMPL domain-containing protein [Candidatus Nealsonbacteria bacterium]|nr:SIMPL domain-containing protein [Candidatus Nealsonbacteria bacterium]
MENIKNKIKDALWASVILALISFSYSAVSFVRSYDASTEPSSFRSFSVSGEGKVAAIPDLATFSFSVVTEGGLGLKALQEENTLKANQAIEFLKSKSIESKDIKTQSYLITPRYKYYSCPEAGGDCLPPTIVGYTVTQAVEVKIRDFSIVGEIISEVVNRGANAVSNLAFTIEDRTELENRARAEAIALAKEKAKATAKAGGFRLGKLLSIQEGGITPYSYPLYEFSAKGGSSAPAVEPGSQEIKVSVTLQYEIE